jgi:hypothetical protein
MNDAAGPLIPTPRRFSAAEYLTYLSLCVPRDLAEQLTRDADPDLRIDEYVEVDDLIRPLSSHSFPAECERRTVGVFRLASILEHTIIGYSLDVENGVGRHDPYKQIYVASLYLYCCLHGAMRSRFYVDALLVLTAAGRQMDLEGRLQVGCFLGSLFPILPRASVADPSPRSTMLIALSALIGSLFDDVRVLTDRTMREEDFARVWQTEAGTPCIDHPSLGAMKMLLNSVKGNCGS